MKILCLFFALTFSALGHEGHDHDSPLAIQAPKGGVIKALEEMRVEVVSRGPEVKIYLYDKAMKARETAGVKIAASAELPRTKKTEAIPLVAEKNFFTGKYDAKGLHRYTLKLNLTDPKTGHDDILSFTIEPRK